MDEINNLTYNDFSAGQVAGDDMTIITINTTVDELISWVFNAKALWFYDNIRYRVVIFLEEIENGMIVYYFNDSGEIVSHQFGGDS